MLKPHWLLPDSPFENYEAYRAATGECAVRIAQAMAPSAVVRRVQQSGLRGRGGAGFPTGTKWRTLAEHECARKFVVCNAAEGEPGTFKDRFLMRMNPYPVLEGMVIAARAIGSRELYIALKASFTQERDRLSQAAEALRAQGLLQDLELSIVDGPEEYLFGEEKALLNVIEGEGPLPREPHNPPYERGLFAAPNSPNPALVNNAETYAHVPSIVRDGPLSFWELGTKDTPGTLLFTVSGDVQKPGVYELEAGVPLRTLLYEVAGGPLPGRSISAVLSGVSSGVIRPGRFDTPADFGSLHLIGSGLGSAGFMVFDDSRSIPRVAQSVLRFLYVESCNQCSACKNGLMAASTALDELFETEDPQAREAVIDRARVGAQRAPQGNRCFLPQQGSIVLSSILNRYADSFTAHAPSEPVVLPKLVDLVDGRFVFDERQSLKQPDWSYAEPPSTPSDAPASPPSRPSSLLVELSPALKDALTKRAQARGESLEEAAASLLAGALDLE